ncbi:MAG: xylulokinase [Bacillota bacterium]
MAERYILAIDLGTSALKVALVSTAGTVVGLETEPIALHLLDGGGAEQDPDEWWSAIRRAAGRLLARGLAERGAVVAVGCTSQWSGTVPVDRNGRPLMRSVIWMDSRGAEEIRRMAGGPVAVAGYGVGKLYHWIRKTGGAPSHSGKDPLAHILFIRRAFPEVYAATHKFLEPKDYLNLCLTGEFAATYDSIALHWVTDNRDLARVRYDAGLLAAAGLDREKLPDLVGATDVLGRLRPEVADELGLSREVKVVGGTPDIHAAAVGSGATRDLAPHLYVGTSSWLTCHVARKKTDLLQNMATLPSAIPGRYFVANEQETAGACLAYLRDSILYEPGEAPADALQRLEAMAAGVAAGSDGLIFTPWLYGERTPVEDHLIRGGFHNLSLKTTRSHLARAVMEGVAYNARWLLGAVEGFVGQRLEPIRIIGGGAQSNLWCQIYADVLNRTIQQVASPLEAGVRGAALLAAVGLGELQFSQVDALVTVARSFDPTPAHRGRYDQLFRAFLDLYRQNRKIYARLNTPR